MPGVPSPRLASTAGCRLRGLPVGKACLGGVPVQEVVEAGFCLRAAGGGSLGAPICGVSCGGNIRCHRCNFLPHKGGCDFGEFVVAAIRAEKTTRGTLI